MNILERMKRVAAGFKTKGVVFEGGITGSLLGSGEGTGLRAYHDSLYLHIAVSMIMQRASSVQLRLYEIINSDGKVQELLTHPVLDLIARPNGIQKTQREFTQRVVMYYLLTGDALIYKERGANGKTVVGLHVLRPDLTTLAFDPKGNLVAYQYASTGGTTITLNPSDIIHIRRQDPLDQHRGIGVLKPAKQRIIAENEASKLQAAFFKGAGHPDVVVFMDSDPDEAELKEARKRWYETYGHGSGGQVGFFGKKIKDIKPLSLTPEEMKYIDSQKFLRDDILAALHIPKAMITSDDVNLANANTAKQMFLENAVVPCLDMIVDAYNNALASEYDDVIYFDYENPVQEDRTIKLQEAEKLTGKVFTQNEMRERYNLPPVDTGDELQDINTPQQTVTLAMAEQRVKARNVLRSRPNVTRKMKAVEAIAEVAALANLKTPERKIVPVFQTKEAKQAYAKAYLNAVDKTADKFAKDVKKQYAEMIDRITKWGEKAGYTEADFADINDEIRLAAAFFAPILTDMYEKHGQDILNAIWKATSKKAVNGEQFFTTAKHRAAITKRVEFFTNSMVSTSFEHIRKQIATGVKDGKGPEAISRGLIASVDEYYKGRAFTISRTESNYMLSSATEEAYDQSAIVSGKEWITAGDSEVRPEHQANEAAGVIGKNQSFPSGESFPGESTINCRCVLAPAV